MRVEELSRPFGCPGHDVESQTREPGIIGKVPIGRQYLVAVGPCPADVIGACVGDCKDPLGERITQGAGDEGVLGHGRGIDQELSF